MRLRNSTRDKRSIPATIAIVGQTRHHRESIVQAFAARRRFILVDVGEFNSSDLGRLTHLQPEVVLLDLPETHARSLVREVRRALPKSSLVAINASNDEAEILSLFEVGLTGFVPKQGSLEDVHAAIECALHGELHCPPRIAAAVVRRLSELGEKSAGANRDHVLSSRELEVVRLVEQGLTNKEIALRLRIESATVKNHVHRILGKLSVHHRREAVAQIRGSEPQLGVVRGKTTPL
jgi:DNA-binding NarL/FixJ family response regulator